MGTSSQQTESKHMKSDTSSTVDSSQKKGEEAQALLEPDQYVEDQELQHPLLENQSINIHDEIPAEKSKRKCSFPILWTMFAFGVLVFLTCWIFSLPVFLIAVCMGSCFLRSPQMRKRELSGWIANVVMLVAYIACASTFGYFAAHLVKLGETTPSKGDTCNIGCYQNFKWLTAKGD